MITWNFYDKAICQKMKFFVRPIAVCEDSMGLFF